MTNADDNVAGHVKTSHYHLNPSIIKQYQSNHVVMLNDARLGKPGRLAFFGTKRPKSREPSFSRENGPSQCSCIIVRNIHAKNEQNP